MKIVHIALCVCLAVLNTSASAGTFRLQLKGTDTIAGPYDDAHNANVKIGDTDFSLVRPNVEADSFSLKHTASGKTLGPFSLKGGSEITLGTKTFIILVDTAKPETPSEPQEPVVVIEKYPNGNAKEKYRHVAGNKIGPYLAYFENGRPKIIANYKDGLLNGSYTESYDNARTKKQCTYRDGKIEGTLKINSEDGKPQISATYKNGILHGKYDLYPSDGKKNKPITLFWENGRITKIGQSPAYPKSIADIRREMLAIGKPGDSFYDMVKGEPAKNAGAPTEDEERLAALRVLQAYRYLSDVPYKGMKLSDELNSYCLAGAGLCSKIGHLDHTPENPGIPEPDYKKGYKGTSSSNLSQGRSNIPQAVHGWMDDSDPSNIAALGHRRWCLCPALMTTGFGRVERFAAMWSFPSGGGKSSGAAPIYYPARGYMPIEFFGSRHAWNISIADGTAKKEEIILSIRSVDPEDGLSDPLPLDYINVDTAGYGISYCLIFRPQSLDMTPGKVYFVEVLNTGAGDLSFLAEFFSLAQAPAK